MQSRNIRRKFGQNYLSDPAIIFEMGQAISPKKQDYFFEIGPGMGALTNVLNIDEVNVKALDIDPNNIDYLSKKFQKPGNFDFTQGDILSESLNFLYDQRYRIVGNLPYNISTQIILRFIDWHESIKDMHFLVQKEVADKITGNIGSKNWGKLSIKLSYFFETQILFDVPPEAFDIKPKVNSSFIRLIPKENFIDSSLKQSLFKIIDMSFVSRRKNIKNNLKKVFIDWGSLGINPNLRPEEVSLEEYLEISKNYKK